MSSPTGPDLSRMMPGMDFLQSLMAGAASTRSAGAVAAPPWLLPTLDLDELDKRIQDLKTVHFWLEQNARLLATTIQTLEVQRMTVATLQGLNVSAADLMKGWTSAAVTEGAAAPEAAAKPASTMAGADAGPEAQTAPDTAAAEAVGAGVQQAMQWWQQVQQQFGALAAVSAANVAAATSAQGAEPAADAPDASDPGAIVARKRARRPAARTPRPDA